MKWISCSEKMPVCVDGDAEEYQESVPVLAWVTDAGIEPTTFDRNIHILTCQRWHVESDYSWYCAPDLGLFAKDVTHWAKLPDKPENENG